MPFLRVFAQLGPHFFQDLTMARKGEREQKVLFLVFSSRRLSIFINLNVARKNWLSPLFPSVEIATFWLETIVFENLIISLKRYNLIHYCKRESCLISCFLTAQTGRMAFIARVPEP